LSSELMRTREAFDVRLCVRFVWMRDLWVGGETMRVGRDAEAAVGGEIGVEVVECDVETRRGACSVVVCVCA
jgi:hypothetical protein